jgi:mannitol/fructose-specific phosphotransferase system IIA component (Ntr-type)
MKLCDLLETDKILIDIDIKLTDLFKKDGRVIDIDYLKKAVFEREKIMSTGVGLGFAIPHAKTNAVNNVIAAFARSKKSIDFQSLDGKPVDIFFLLVGTEAQVGLHIKLLSRISRLMNRDGFREKLTSASTPEEIRKLFCDEENNFFEIT